MYDFFFNLLPSFWGWIFLKEGNKLKIHRRSSVCLSVCRNVSVKLRIFFYFTFFFIFFFQQGRRAKRYFGKYFLLKIGIFILVQRYLYAPIATAAYASRKKQLSSKYVFLKKDLPLKREVSPQIQMINLLKKKKRFFNNLFFLFIYFKLLFSIFFLLKKSIYIYFFF